MKGFPFFRSARAIVLVMTCFSGAAVAAEPKSDPISDAFGELDLPIVDKMIGKKSEDKSLADAASPKNREKIFGAIGRQIVGLARNQDTLFRDSTHAMRFNGRPTLLVIDQDRVKAVSIGFKNWGKSEERDLAKLRQEIERRQLPLNVEQAFSQAFINESTPRVVKVSVKEGYWYVAMHPELPEEVKAKLSKDEVCAGAPLELVNKLLGEPVDVRKDGESSSYKWEIKEWFTSFRGPAGSFSGGEDRVVRIVRARVKDGVLVEVEDQKVN